jgi:hypothetical protein
MKRLKKRKVLVRISGMGSGQHPGQVDKFRSPKVSMMRSEICLFYPLAEKILLLCPTSIDQPQPLDLVIGRLVLLCPYRRSQALVKVSLISYWISY